MRAARSVLILMLMAIGAAAAQARQSDPAPDQIVSIGFRPTDIDFPNPERGFYRPLGTDLAGVDPAEIADAYGQGYRLVYARIDLAPYRDADLPADFLARLDRGFAAARRAGVKLIVRAAYNYPEGEHGYEQAQDAPLPRVLAHLAQLKPLWAGNGDVIAFVQAGMIGAWGEWHTSSNNLTEPAAREAIKDALLDAAPAGRFVQFRYPPYIMQWTPALPPLSAALSGVYRIGFHNDCFLAGPTDVGTFDEDAAVHARQYRYLDQLGDLAPFGGETCNAGDAATTRGGCDVIRAEGAQLNLTYLNATYYRPLFEDRWVRDGCMVEVNRKMGYRLALVSAAYPARVRRGAALDMALVVRNQGWARVYNQRPIDILLRNMKSGRTVRLRAAGADPRRWVAGTDSDAMLQVTVPANLEPGAYAVSLTLPDAAPRLAGDVRYAIRPENADDAKAGQAWDKATGAFAFGSSVTVD